MAREDAYPDFFPDDVPPTDAVDASGNMYRLVKFDPPTAGCFQCTFVENGKPLSKYLGDRKALACGVSFLDTYEKALHTQQILANAMKFKLIAEGELVQAVGVMKSTGSQSHYTVWIREGCEPHDRFQCVK